MTQFLADIEPARARDQATAFGDGAIAVKLDVTSSASWASARQVARDRFGSVDVLCNNAGVSMPREPLSQVAPEAFARVMAINVTGVYLGIATFADDLRAQRSGHIVDRQSVVSGKSVSVRVDLGGLRCIQKQILHTHRNIN